MSERQELYGVACDLALALQASMVYPESHQKVHELIERLHRRVAAEAARLSGLGMGFLGDHVVVDRFPFLGANPTLGRLIRRMGERGIEKVTFREGITLGELKRFVYLVAEGREDVSARRWESIACGRIRGVGGEESEEAPSLVAGGEGGDFLLAGAAEVLHELLAAVAQPADAPRRIAEGRDIVASVMKGLRTEGCLVDRLLRMQAHDDYTVTHSLNVCVIVTGFCLSLGLPEATVHEAGLAALLHDVGKEMVPAEILNKPGKLDAGEFARMADHPVLGADLLRRLAPGSQLPMIVAFEHHIKHDRSGYPKTRHASALHPASAMTQIADVYDALRTYRPYRGSLSLATTLEIMDKGRGSEFDPVLYDRFVSMVGRPAPEEGEGRGAPS